MFTQGETVPLTGSIARQRCVARSSLEPERLDAHPPPQLLDVLERGSCGQGTGGDGMEIRHQPTNLAGNTVAAAPLSVAAAAGQVRQATSGRR
jgi:hypothetical protein